MNPLRPYRLNHIASFAIVALLSACGGGGGGSAPLPAQAATAPASSAPAPSAPSVVAPSDLSFPPAATDAADKITGTLLPATAPDDTGGEAPYPDLRLLPTLIMPFEPVVVGDVSRVAVTTAQ